MLWLQNLIPSADAMEDTGESASRRRFLAYMGTLMSIGALLWGVLAMSLGRWTAAAVPFAYIALTATNLWWLSRAARFETARIFQVGISLLLPFVFQWAMGGFVNSGGAMLWALLAIVGSLTFEDARRGVLWLELFIVLTIVSGVLDPRFAAGAAPSSRVQVALFFTVNVAAVAMFIQLLVVWLLVQRDRAVVAAETANRQLSESNAELSAAVEVAEQATEAKSRFLATMSHELRTPLNAMLGMSDLLADSQLDEVQSEYLHTVRSSGRALLGLVSDILDISKIEAGQLHLHRSPMSCHQGARAVLRMVEAQASRRGLELELVIEEGTREWIELDELRWRQVLLNLLSNAVKFTERGKVVLTVGPLQGQSGIRCTVRDTGIGIAPEIADALTQPFVQADASITRRYGGTGLGLAIVRHLTYLHGGELDIESVPGGGSTFSVTFPGRFCSTPTVTAIRTAAGSPIRARVLLVEDNPVNRKVAGAMLRKLGATVETAVHGRDALAKMERDRFDIVLLDMMMPEMDGLEAARRIREMDIVQPVLIAMTANVTQEDRSACTEAGMDRFLAKPVTLEQLRKTMKKALLQA